MGWGGSGVGGEWGGGGSGVGGEWGGGGGGSGVGGGVGGVGGWRGVGGNARKVFPPELDDPTIKLIPRCLNFLVTRKA